MIKPVILVVLCLLFFSTSTVVLAFLSTKYFHELCWIFALDDFFLIFFYECDVCLLCAQNCNVFVLYSSIWDIVPFLHVGLYMYLHTMVYYASLVSRA